MGLFGTTIKDIQKWEKEKKVDKIATAFKNKKIEVQKAAIIAFGNLRVVNGAPFLIHFLNDKDLLIRKLAENAIIKIGKHAYNDLRNAEKQISEMIEKQILELNHLAKGNIGTWDKPVYIDKEKIISIVNDQYAKITTSISQLLEHLDLLENVRIKGISRYILDNIRDAKDLYLLINIFGKIEDENQRSEIFHTICDNYNSQLSDIIISSLKDKNSSIRALAIKTLERIEKIDIVKFLISALNDADFNVRTESVALLSKHRDKRALEPLLNIFDQSDPYTYMNLTILYTLISLGHKPDISTYIEDLNNKNYDRRKDAANAIIEIAKLDFSLVRNYWNVLVPKIEKKNIDHIDGKSFYFSDCGGHEDKSVHRDSPGIGISIPVELRAKR